MKPNSDRIHTTHVGSLPRSKEVTDVVFARERGDSPPEGDAVIAAAVDKTVAQQVAAGVDYVSDGEMSKISYATYIKDRLTGFDGDSDRQPPSDLEAFPGFLARQASSGGTPTYRRPCCVDHITVSDRRPCETDIAHFDAAISKHQPTGGFMNAASPGVIALFQPDRFYNNHDDYLEALSRAMAVEYQMIIDAGLDLQLDSPDIGLGRHMMFKDKSDDDYVRLASSHIEALNVALEGIPKERVRLHVCWGNYEGPHHHDASMSLVLPIALRANIGVLLFESSNPRHAHEWRVFAETDLPEDLLLAPGVIDSTTNFIEHPELVAERIERFANIVGRERVIASSDCGFSTFAGYGAVDEDIVWAKLASMRDGAAIASQRLWRHAA
ncbi:MAG: cobalamin-independent methionine synthase II family protein [Pseudomonadota bacterium]